MAKSAEPIAISKLAASIQPSATLAAAAKARQMKAEGIPVFDFSLGEPDFPTPEHICRAAFKAMQEGHTHYTPASGIPELRSAIARVYQKLGLRCTADQVIVSNGAKHSLYNTLAALCGPGDEVIIPSPYWVSYSDLVQMTGASYVLVDTTL
ncbi:MAG TPA: aminotransferase class I/II-fold pyridoxal phosphate-dependent enzyme, partial [Gemmataceae bacterium]|nr:aminotransferase class I/II-fold pyridoxal phosphate-dependent enzyme [Gemmataceae bacterium]